MRAEWPSEYIDPQLRAKLREAAALLALDRTPELLFAAAIFEVLTDEQKERVRSVCNARREANEGARGLAAMVEQRTFGDQWDLMRAMDFLRERKGY